MCASALGYVETVMILLDAGADPDYRDARGGTAYDVACEKGETETANVLSVFGAHDT